VVASRQEENDLLVRLALGLVKPVRGTIHLLGKDLGTLVERRLEALRKRVGVVYPGGGLVSNLKVWENLVLPLEYHYSYSQQEVDQRATQALNRAGYTGGLMELPGHLSHYQKKQVGFARALIAEPALVIYNALLDGLSRGEQAALLAAALGFHQANPQATGVFLTTHEETLREIPLGSRIVIKGSSATND
jgi:phospholipid/cholesterol/gamma-HCH transport system ATP-binding protein